MTKKRYGVDRGQPVLGRQRDDQIAMSHARRCWPDHDQAAIRLAREGRDAALDLVGVAHADRASTPLRATAPRSGSRQTRRTRRATAGSRRTATRVTRGAISLSSSSHFPLMLNSNEVNPVALPPGRARLSTQPPPTGSIDVHEHDRHGAARLLQRAHDRRHSGQDDIRRERNQFRRVSAKALEHRRRPSGSRSARCGRRSSPVACSPCANAAMRACSSGSLRAPGHQHADAPHPLGLLRARRERPRAAAPPSSVMNSRRFIRSPRRRGRATSAGFLDRRLSQSRG